MKTQRDIVFGNLQNQCSLMKGLFYKFENKPEPYKSFCDHNKYNFKNKPVYWLVYERFIKGSK